MGKFLKIVPKSRKLLFFLLLCLGVEVLLALEYDDYFKKSHYYERRPKKSSSEKTAFQVKKAKLFAGKIGVVDVATLCIVHPLMDYYFIAEKKFVKPYKGNIDQEYQQRLSNYKKKVEEAKEKIKELQAKVKNLEVYREKLKEKLNSKIAMKRNTMVYKLSKLPVSERPAYKKKIEAEIAELEKAVFEKIRNVNSQIVELSKKYDQYKLMVNSTFYAEADEEEQIVGKILEDVVSVSKAVAKKYKITYLFNSSDFFMKGIKRSEDQYELLFKEKYDYERFSQVPPSDVGKGTGSKEYYWYKISHQPLFIGPFWESPVLRKLILDGAMDITPIVITEIFKKYHKSKDQLQAVLEAYKMKSDY